MWTDLVGPEDALHLMVEFGAFHDSCIREMHLWTGYSVNADLAMACPGHLDTNLRILVQRQSRSPSAIELLFEQVTRLNFVPYPENHLAIIFGATLLRHEADWIWSPDSEVWSPGDPARDT